MAFDGDFRTFLAASTRVQAHVGSSDGARIHHMRIPEGEADPSIRYQRIATSREHTHGGPTGLPMVRMQVDSYGESAGDAVTTAEAVRKALDGFQGTMGGSGVAVAFGDDEDTRYEDDAQVYRVRQDYLIHYREATT